MLNPKINKKLIINPTREEQADLTMVNPKELFKTLMFKVAGVRTQKVEDFKPFTTKETHLRIFVSNVTPINKSIMSYTGKDLNTFEETTEYFMKVGTEIFGPGWLVELLKHEVQLAPGVNFGVLVQSEADIIAIAKGFDDFATYEIRTNNQKDNKNNHKKGKSDEQQ